jgi:class 3 adenylate cyclase/SAM-dependent methyltransferase
MRRTFLGPPPGTVRRLSKLATVPTDSTVGAMGRSATTTVLFSDIVGSTDFLSVLGERAWDDVRREHFSVLRSSLADHDGSEVKNTGDGIMAAFDSVVDAVNCAVAMQQRSFLVLAAGRPVAIRIGLAMGEALLDQGDWFGTPVVEAARLCAAAGAGESWTTALVQMLAGSQSEATFVPVGERLLKGFERPTEVYSIEPRQELQGSVFAEPGQHEEMGELLVAAMDYWGSLPSMRRVRTAASAQLAALPGDVICDIGCGPGTELVRIAQVIGPDGVAIGIDPSGTMLEEAQRRADGGGVNVELHLRDGRDTGLPADRCDAVRMERVIQHVGDIDGLVAEAIRITRPRWADRARRLGLGFAHGLPRGPGPRGPNHLHVRQSDPPRSMGRPSAARRPAPPWPDRCPEQHLPDPGRRRCPSDAGRDV